MIKDKMESGIESPLVCFVRFFPLRTSPHSIMYQIRESDIGAEEITDEIAVYDNESKCLLFRNPDNEFVYRLNEVAHQLRGINVYFIVERYKESMPIILNHKNELLVKKFHTPADMANKTNSKVVEKLVKKSVPRDRAMILFVLASILLPILVTASFFVPVILFLTVGA